MGSHPRIDFDSFPPQGRYLGRRAKVCFNYDTSRLTGAVVVRDDEVDPYVTILQLDNGRFVLATECQYRPEVES